VKHKATKPKNAAITDSRPQIEITFDEHIVVDEALAIIKHDPALFQRGNALVIGASVAMDTKRKPKGLLHLRLILARPIIKIARMFNYCQWMEKGTSLISTVCEGSKPLEHARKRLMQAT